MCNADCGGNIDWACGSTDGAYVTVYTFETDFDALLTESVSGWVSQGCFSVDDVDTDEFPTGPTLFIDSMMNNNVR